MKTKQYALMGSIVGDICGSRFEWKSAKDISPRFKLITSKSHYTDDTCLTVAIADALLHNREYEKFLKYYTRKNSNLGYGKMYLKWAFSEESNPYGSYANGAAMRLSSIPFYYSDFSRVYLETVRSTIVTHNHPKAINASLMLAAGIYLARKWKRKDYIKRVLESNFEYNKSNNKEDPNFFKNSLFAEEAVNFAFDCFFSSTSYEHAIRTAILAGGDTDTLAAITGSIAFAFYEEMPQKLHDTCFDMLPIKYQQVIKKMEKNREEKD